MTQARMDWKWMELTLDGHAGAGEKGQDLVCAAISMLSQALVTALQELEHKTGCTRVKWSGTPEEGRLKVRATVNWTNLTLVRAYFEVAVTGLRMLGERYPEYIRLEEEK